jgi:hypothetical protein
LRAERYKIERVKLNNLRLSIDPSSSDGTNLTEITYFSLPKPKKRERSVTDSKVSVADRLKSIMKGGDSKKEDTKILEGSSDIVLNEFERVLIENGITFE